jgi:5-methyltetrahydrofolate--homocysteine methyltransferase
MEGLWYEMNLESALIARKAADSISALTPEQPRFVAGAINPTTKLASMSPDVNNPVSDQRHSILLLRHIKSRCGLIDGGVDILLIETITDTLNCKAALYAIDI